MAILKARAARDLSQEDLEKRMKELKLELAKERGKIAVGGVPENPGRIREVRRTVARIMTVMSARRSETTESGKTKRRDE